MIAITVLLVVIAAILNAVMDSIENEHIWDTKFANYKDKPIFNNFIYKRESWNKAKKIFNYKLDLWHISKSAMLLAIFGAAATNVPITGTLWELLLRIVGFSLIWVLTFNLFYNKVFGK